jgi:DNA gyrase/topoisomerase IV subunit A
VVTEISLQVNKSRLIEQAASLVNEKKLEGISGNPATKATAKGMRIVFELKRGEQGRGGPQLNLYKHTQLQ